MTRPLRAAALAALLLLTACSPATQAGLQVVLPGSGTPSYIQGAALQLDTTVPAETLTDQTPDRAFVTFPDCHGAAIAVPEVRRLGLEAADAACRQVSTQQVGSALIQLAVTAAVVGVVTYLIGSLFRLVLSDAPQPQHAAP